MMAYGGEEEQPHSIINSAIIRDEWSASRSGCFIPRERGSCSHRVEGYVGPSACLDILEKKRKLFPGRK
jgi:hypothetical protein